jgi:hypothetical protein
LGLHPSGDGVSPHVPATVLGVPEVRLRAVVRELTHGKRMVDQIGGRLLLDAVVREHARNVAEAVDSKDERKAIRQAFTRWYAAGAITACSSLTGPGAPGCSPISPSTPPTGRTPGRANGCSPNAPICAPRQSSRPT